MSIDEALKLGLDLSEARKLAFMTAPDLETALAVAWRGHERAPKGAKEFLYHYTSLPNLMSNILSGTWYLNCSTSRGMNDRQEVKKFGNEEIARHTYQLSFGRGVRESTAFWGLYGRGNPFAIKVLMPEMAIESWLQGLKDTYQTVEFKDIVYASIPNRSAKKPGDKKRGCHLFWDGVTCSFAENEKVKSMLPEQLKQAKYTGFIKDVEWMHENETRLCIRCPGSTEKAIRVPLDPMLVEKMTFTFSPWADEDMAAQVKNALIGCLKINQEKLKSKVEVKKEFRDMCKRFHRSTVVGALNFAKDMLRNCNAKRCPFGVLLAHKD